LTLKNSLTKFNNGDIVRLVHDKKRIKENNCSLGFGIVIQEELTQSVDDNNYYIPIYWLNIDDILPWNINKIEKITNVDNKRISNTEKYLKEITKEKYQKEIMYVPKDLGVLWEGIKVEMGNKNTIEYGHSSGSKGKIKYSQLKTNKS
jgi:hypothetical protein